MDWVTKARIFRSALLRSVGAASDAEPRILEIEALLAEPCGTGGPTEPIEITHAISPARIVLDLPPSTGSDVLTRLLDDHGPGRDSFLHLFATLPELLAESDGRVGGAWPRYPADPRAPDASIWHHSALVSALVSCDGEPSVLGFSLDPVRAFAWSGSSIPELWTGMWLASYLVWVGLRTVCEDLGPDHVLYPSVSRQPWFRQWVGGGVAAPTVDELALPGLSNRIVAIVPQPQADVLAGRMAEAIRVEWRSLTSLVADRVGEQRASWEGECDGTWEFAWAVTPWRASGPQGLAAAYRECFERNQRQLSEAVRRLTVPREAARNCPHCGRAALPSGEPTCAACLTKRLLPLVDLPAPLDQVFRSRALHAEGTDAMALLVMDGDHSSGLSGGTAPGFATWTDVLHSRAGVSLEGKRLVTPGVHLFLSEALANFGMRCVPEILGRHGGVPLYVGGDDVVALLPADRVLSAAQEIRDRFRTSFVVCRTDGRIEECPSPYRPTAGERLLANPGRAGTTSAAVVFRPGGGPIRMQQARDLLDEEAKDRAGRDAIAVCFPGPSGGTTRWSSKWERPDGERTVDRLLLGVGDGPEEREIASLIRPRSVDRSP